MAKAIYTSVPRQLSDILSDVLSGRIGLPDLQRPFVWKDNKVRDLYDSMMKGFPIGYIMLWESPSEYEDKKTSIGVGEKSYKVPKDLVIDGQQRLPHWWPLCMECTLGIEILRNEEYEFHTTRLVENSMYGLRPFKTTQNTFQT